MQNSLSLVLVIFLTTATFACSPERSDLDQDGDGIADGGDNCPYNANPDQADGDGDGEGDACDACFGANITGDPDGDGNCDDVDICQGDDATGDSDGDGNCDDVDICQGDNATGDSDSDGICDSDDICPGWDDITCSNLPWRGGTGGSLGTAACPANYVAVGVRIRRGDWSDAVYIICRELDNAGGLTANETEVGGIGGTGGTEMFFRCDSAQADGVMVGQRVWVGSASPYIHSVGAICQQLSVMGNEEGQHTTTYTVGDESGLVPTTLYEDLCPASQMTWGFHANAGAWIDAIQFRCAAE